MATESRSGASETDLAQCPLLYRSLGERFIGREHDIALLNEHLTQRRLGILRAEQAGQGATRLAIEYAHRFADVYPGGVVWLAARGSQPKELAADVIEALSLPSSVSQRYPFVGAEQAYETMWRGLHGRPPTLIVVDGWEDWDDANRWRGGDANVHTIAVAPSRIAIDHECRFPVGPLAVNSVRELLPKKLEDCADSFAKDALALDVFLASSGDIDTRVSILGQAIESLSPNAKRLLATLTLFNAEPVPIDVLARAIAKIESANERPVLPEALTELERRALVQLDVFGEPCVHVRVLSEARERLTPMWKPVLVPVLESVTEAMEATSMEAPHTARRVTEHARRILSCDFDGNVPSDRFARFAAVAGATSRHGFAAKAAEAAVAAARAAGDDKALLEALKAHGHALSETRDLARAQEVLRQAVSIAERLHGEHAVEVARVLYLLARALGLGVCGHVGDEELAVAVRAYEIMKRVFGPDDARVGGAHWDLALKFAVRGEFTESLAHHERGIAIVRATDGEGLDDHLQPYAMTLVAVGRFEEAFIALDEALEVRRKNRGPWVLNVLIAAREAAEKSAQPERLLRMINGVLAWPELEDDPENDSSVTRARLVAMRAAVLATLNRSAEAAADAALALPILVPLHGEAHARIRELRSMVAKS